MSLEKMPIMYVVFQESNFAARGFNIILYSSESMRDSDVVGRVLSFRRSLQIRPQKKFRLTNAP